MNQAPAISVVIPCLNEEQGLPKFLDALPKDASIEYILVDGGSSDKTVPCLKSFADQRSGAQDILVVQSEAGRAKQMNRGAEHARAEVLVFLHADTYLPGDFIERLRDFTEQEDKRWGRFDLRLDSQRLVFRVIEWFINHRSALTKVATGDQVIFVEQDLFKLVDGFENIPLMEDVALSKALRAHSDIFRPASRVISSSRRWEQHGTLKTVLLMWHLRFLFYLGADPKVLHSRYYQKEA